ncbi:MAG: M3 family metallopeptidase, partial [Alistipes sp.]|nr:M3 family metallopeptidase [Alistipes sp.]
MKRFLFIIASIGLLAGLSACNKSTQSSANPFFEEVWDTPYGAPPFDRIEIAHYKPAFEQGMALHAEEIDQIVALDEEPTFENVILAYDNSGQMLNRVSSVFSLLEAADTSDEMQAISAEMMPRLAAHSDAITMNEELFAKIKAVYDRRGALGLDKEQLRLTELIYDRFVRSGALLSEENKSRLKEINSELTTLSVQFAANLLAETNAFALEVPSSRLDGLSQAVRAAAKEQAEQMGKEGYVFTLHAPSRLPVLTYADDRELREEVYKAYISRGDNGNEYDNNAIIASIASLRYEKAKMLGFDSYAHYVTSQQMAGSPKAAYDLLEGIWTPALATAKDELARMKSLFVRDHGYDKEFAAWDWWYYAEKVRQRDYQLDENKVREYLPLENVKGGVFFLANRLFGITLRPITAPLYNDECEAYEVIDNNDKPLGMIYFDFHPRAGKGGGAWFGNYVSQAFKDGERVCPVGTIVCNFTRPTDSTPALLSIDEVETLFHEFGHALHVMFAQVKYRGLSEVEGDFVELPSQILENWAFSREMLKQYAVHYRTSEVMPDSMIDKIHRAAKFNEGFATTELVAAALADLDIHSLQSADKIDVAEFQRKALVEKRGLIPQIEPRYRYTYFQHIFNGGYSSGYYFYTWAEVLDKDAFAAFAETGDIFNRRKAQALRKLLASG